MIEWWADPKCLDAKGGQLFADIDGVFALQGELVSSDPLSSVLRVECTGAHYYVKRYQGNGTDWKRSLRQWQFRPRIKKEWENLQAFQSWGIPTARLVAYGLERHCGRFWRGALVTSEIQGATDLAKMARNNDARLHDRAWVTSVARQIARVTRIMHGHGFAHNDLKWRNVLVTDQVPPRVFLIDCPSGNYWWRPFLNYRIIKDLACLDKVAKYQLSRVQRLRFFLEYREHQRLDADDKRLMRKILSFFEGRE